MLRTSRSTGDRSPGGHVVLTCLHATVSSAAAALPVLVRQVSEDGFVCEGVGLERAGRRVRLVLELERSESRWSPRVRRGSGRDPDLFAADADVLFVDLGGPAADAPLLVRLGGRFTALDEAQRRSLLTFVAREAFRAHELRTRGGAVPAPTWLGGPSPDLRRRV